MASFYSQFFDVSKLPGYAARDVRESRAARSARSASSAQLARRLFVSVDYVKQHWTGLDQTVDLNAPSLFVRTAPGQVRSAAAADATRPIVPVNGGFRQINVVENLGVADYDGLQTMVRWQNERSFLSVSYTLSKATNTTEPNGNGAGQNDFNQLGEAERGPSLLDQRHRAVIFGSYRLPLDITVGTVDVARLGEAVQRDDRRGQQRRRQQQRSAGHQRLGRDALRLSRDAASTTSTSSPNTA